MAKRKIIRINENRCNGCGLCIPNCPEGAIQIIDGVARLIGDLFCDGLGACIGHCPEGAITIEEREAEKYDERKVMENIVRQGSNVIKAHLEHLEEHNQSDYLRQALDYLKEKGIDGHSVCPGSMARDFTRETHPVAGEEDSFTCHSQLNNWPVQIKLVPPNASYFQGADLLIAADCVAFSYANFHADLLKDKILLVGCPKLDDAQLYREKLGGIFKINQIRSVTCVHMEVPCCFGLVSIVKSALTDSGKNIPYNEVTIGIKGEKK